LSVDLLGIGKSGLFTAKKSMETTSHNIANANTEGFSRQEVRTKTGITINEGPYVMGTGVDIQTIKRNHDDLVEKKLNSSISQHNYNEERTNQLGHIEEVFNEVNSEGMNKILNRFFNSFRELANRPEDETVRGLVRENAKIVVSDFHRVQGEIDQIRAGINKKITLIVDDINHLAKNISKLNREIATHEVSGAEANDLRDQRDSALRQLAEHFPVSAYYDEHNRFVVNVEGLGTLVSGDVEQELMVGNRIDPADSNTQKPALEIFFKSRPADPISGRLKNGNLGAFSAHVTKTCNKWKISLMNWPMVLRMPQTLFTVVVMPISQCQLMSALVFRCQALPMVPLLELISLMRPLEKDVPLNISK